MKQSAKCNAKGARADFILPQTGVNTDQCVGGTLTDSFSKGYDCIMLGDGAATTSPEYAQKCYEFNSANTYGFVTSCKQFAAGVERREL